MSSYPSAFQWRNEEDDLCRYGEGISRPTAGKVTRLYRVMVFKSGSRPMIWTTRAETKRHAITYAQNRWPGATVEVA